MWHHRAVEHIRRSVKQRVDLVTVLKNYNSDRIFITTWETKEAFCNSWWWCNLVPFFFWVESNWFNSHHSYSSFYTSVALLTAVSRFCFCVRKAHRGEVRFWKRSWSWWAWTSQQQDCMYFFTWGANAEWKDPLLGNIISLGKKTHVSDIFVYLWSPFLFRLASISPFSLSLSGPIFFRKKKQCIQKGARWASFAASGEPFAWPQYLGKATVAPTLASRRRWVEPPPDVHRRSPIPNLPL